MKAVLTRVSEASVTVDDEVVGSITNGVLALVGIGRDDAPDAWQTMVRKIAELRILPEERSVSEMGAPVLLVSQFTLLGRTARRGGGGGGGGGAGGGAAAGGGGGRWPRSSWRRLRPGCGSVGLWLRRAGLGR